jgi:hypothetical protein
MFAVTYKGLQDTSSHTYVTHLKTYADAIEVEEEFYQEMQECMTVDVHEMYTTRIIEHEA